MRKSILNSKYIISQGLKNKIKIQTNNFLLTYFFVKIDKIMKNKYLFKISKT